MPEVKLPSIAVVAIGVALGILVALNDQVFNFGAPWQVGVNVLLAVAGTLGISIISGPTFQTIIHLPQATCAAIAAALGGLQLVVAQAGFDPAWRTVVQALIVVGGTLGFGPTLNRKAHEAFALARARPIRRGIDGRPLSRRIDG